MSDVVKMVQNNTVRGPEAKAAVVAFLREHADAMEKGTERSADKIVLVMYESVGDAYAVRSRSCNAENMEKVGMLHTAVHDILTYQKPD